ncbi:MAG TPA: hypothetical protein VFZ59_14380 [Verrucomicrobiae bacterium]|nr:hypothetical protein [Verrucomicrobiae bacterium]
MPPAAESTDEDISIPLQSVINALPPDLKRCVVPMDLGGATLTVALSRVLSQLPSGVVKLSFGVLRGAAPQLFSVGAEFDARNIELPLNEILVRINPALLPRPANQRPPATDAMEDSFIVPAPAAPAPQRGNKQPTSGPIRVPVPSSVPAAATTPISKTSIPAKPAPSPTPAKLPSDTPPRESMTVSLASLSAAWPAEVRGEIAQLNCADSQVVLPEQLVKLGMKQGKVAFPWQTIRAWINPRVPSVVSKHDNTTLNLPLEVLMPLFVSRLKQTPKPQSRLVVDESIPPLFSHATPESPATPAEADANKPAASSDVAAPVKPKTPATDFKNRYISPSEVVTQARALEGVAGALVVLPEGLLVAARVATDQNPDALAAFLAQALGRVSQCAEEAQLGELSQLDFIAQGVPWKIFRLHGVLFAAFGPASGMLPHPQLAAIAGEFDRKKRG